MAPTDAEPLNPPASATILVVDDDEAIRRVTARMLARRGYAVIEADSAESALGVLERDRAQVTLVLTDVIMPGMSGGQLAEAIRSRWSDLPTVFMSGFHNDALVHRGVEADTAAFLQKPFTVQALTQVIDRQLARA